jgi:ubiquinone/menaquinone biosynthesis C-methylase UbiE
MTTTTRELYLDYNTAHNDLARRRPAFVSELRYMRAARPGFPAGRVLDVGCGPGAFSEFLRGEGGDMWGLDFDHALVSASQRRLAAGGSRFLVARVEQLPYRDSSFDACIADSILEHVPDWEGTLREATRVLRPGGLLVFYTANRLHPFQQEVNHFPFYPWLPARLKRVVLRWIMAHRPDLVNYTDYPAVNWFTFEQLRRFLEPLGYEVRTRLDLMDVSHLRGWKALVARGLPAVRALPPLRYLYYLYARDVSVYAVKTRAAR